VPAAHALERVRVKLRTQGLGLVVYDAYRPWYVTKVFFDATPPAMRHFVADPAHGSRHNRGCAVDLSLYDLATGEVVEMPSGYDEFTPRAYPDYPGGTSRQRHFRELLRRAMEDEGFAVYEYEWWHFDYHAWREFGIGNEPL
jgi:serine beta-lactamase-like protein LACTB